MNTHPSSILHPPSSPLVVKLRPAGFQKGFGSKPGYPLFNIVAVGEATAGAEEFWLQSTVTRPYMEQLGFQVEVVA